MPTPSASGDLPPEFFKQFPFASNNEEVRNGIFAKKLTDWQANQAARARNPEVFGGCCFSAFAMIPVIGDAAIASKYGIKLLEHAGPALKLLNKGATVLEATAATTGRLIANALRVG